MSDNESEEEMEHSGKMTTQQSSDYNEKQVRRKYRSFREQMIDNRLECVDPNSNLIENLLEEVNKTYGSVTKAREAVTDSIALHELAVLGAERIRNLHCAFRSFNNNEFMDKIKDYMANVNKRGKKAQMKGKSEPVDPTQSTQYVDNEDESDDEETGAEPTTTQARGSKSAKSKYVLTKPIIKSFGTDVMSYFRILPQPKFLLGSLDKQLNLSKKQIVRQRRERKNSDEELRTKIKELDVNNTEDVDNNNTFQETERIYQLLCKYYKKLKGGSLCFYEFVINPDSFSRTIENIFYVSFLVKDGYVKVYLDEDKLPVIEPIPIEEVKAQAEEAANKKANIQSMVSLNKIQWRELIEVFQIEKCLIKDIKDPKKA